MTNKDFNFLPEEITKAQKNRQKINLVILLSILFVVTAFSLLLIPYNEIKRLEGVRDDYERKIQNVIAIEEVERNLSFEERRLEVRQELMYLIEEEEKPMLFFIEKIEETIPVDVSLNAISISANSIQVRGVAKSDIVLANFIRNMKETGLFEGVYGPSFNTSESRDDESRVNFTVECLLRNH